MAWAMWKPVRQAENRPEMKGTRRTIGREPRNDRDVETFGRGEIQT